MSTATARGTSASTVTLTLDRGSPSGQVYVHWIASAWVNPAAGVPTEVYITANMGGVAVVVAAKINRSTVSVRDGLFVEFPTVPMAVGDKAAQAASLVLNFNGTAPPTSDITAGYTVSE